MFIRKNLNAVADEINVLIPSGKTVVAAVQFPGSGSGTLIFEATIDEITWTIVELSTATVSATVVATSIAAAGLWFTRPFSAKRVRLRKSATTADCYASLSLGFSS